MSEAFSFPEGTRLAPRSDVPLNVGTFSVEEIAEANRRHDRHYGFNLSQNNHAYTNLMRFPESVLGPLDWEAS